MVRERQHTDMEILYEDNHLLAVNKPAGISTMGASDADETVVRMAKAYLKQKYQKPGNVYLGVVSRLDKPVTGVLLLARTSKAAARLSRNFRERDVRKIYWGIVTASDALSDDGTLKHWIRKNESQRRMEVCRDSAPGAQHASLNYRVIHSSTRQAWVRIELKTGRKHQIRVQFSAIGCPLVGDQKYASRTSFPKGIALHARHLELAHPVRDSQIRLTAPLPRYWPKPPRQFDE